MLNSINLIPLLFTVMIYSHLFGIDFEVVVDVFK